jgi:hypothetical protein
MQRGLFLNRSGRTMVLMSLLLVALLVVVGCGPRATGGQLAASAGQDQVVIDLPALVVDIQSDGQAAVGGQSLGELGALVGQDLSALNVPADMVDFFTASNIQHIQVDNTADGLLILVNGQPIPSIAWDGEKLVATAEVLEVLGGGVALLDKVLPLVRNLGVGVTLRLPVAAGEAAIPLVVVDSEVAARSLALQQEFLAAVGTPPTFQVAVQYAADGTWTVMNMTQAEWSQIVGAVPWEMFNLPADMVQGASSAGIQEIGFATNSDGIFISINGKTLPYITWAEGRINYVLALAEQTGLLEPLLGADPNMAAIMDTVEQLLPAVQASNVSLVVSFP